VDFCSLFSPQKAGAWSRDRSILPFGKKRKNADAPVAPLGWLAFDDRPTAAAYAYLDGIALFEMPPASLERKGCDARLTKIRGSEQWRCIAEWLLLAKSASSLQRSDPSAVRASSIYVGTPREPTWLTKRLRKTVSDLDAFVFLHGAGSSFSPVMTILSAPSGRGR
jgi:hypothetical protein